VPRSALIGSQYKFFLNPERLSWIWQLAVVSWPDQLGGWRESVEKIGIRWSRGLSETRRGARVRTRRGARVRTRRGAWVRNDGKTYAEMKVPF